MMLIDQTLALIAICVVTIEVLIVFIVNKLMNGTTIEQCTKDGELLAFVQQSLTLL